MSENDINEVQTNEDFLDNTKQEESITSNIFDDFSTDSSLIEDVKKSKEKEEKDVFYYLLMAGKGLQIIFIISLLVCVLGFTYVYIQESESITDSAILDPFCFVIKNEQVASPTTYCSSISSIKSHYDLELSSLKSSQTKGILSNLIVIYENENFLNSKDVTFLRNKSASRTDMIKILEEFDSLKKSFLGVEKNKIQCFEGTIDTAEKTFEIACEAYSQGYENGIIGFSGQKKEEDSYVSGTSASIANSFLNFIEKNSTTFLIFDRQKLFESERILDSSELGITSGFTRKTSFVIKLKINF